MTNKGPKKRTLLQQELEFYNQNKEKLLKEHANRYLLIKGDDLVASYPTNDQAVGEGVRRFGTEPFLVRMSGTDTPVVTVPVLALGLPCQS